MLLKKKTPGGRGLPSGRFYEFGRVPVEVDDVDALRLLAEEPSEFTAPAGAVTLAEVVASLDAADLPSAVVEAPPKVEPPAALVLPDPGTPVASTDATDLPVEAAPELAAVAPVELAPIPDPGTAPVAVDATDLPSVEVEVVASVVADVPVLIPDPGIDLTTPDNAVEV